MPLQDPPPYLVDLPRGVLHVAVELCQHALEQHAALEPLSTLTRPVQMLLGLLKIGAVGLAGGGQLQLALGLVLRAGVLEPLCLAIEPLELTQVVDTLAPVAQAMGVAQLGCDLDGLAHRIPQQVDVRRVVHVGLHYEGVTAGGQTVHGAFFYQLVPRTHHLLIDAIQKLRREQAQVVLERLQLVFGRVGPVAMTQHLAQRAVLIGQFLNAVVVGIQAQAQDSQNQDPPLLHSRTTRGRIGLALALDAIRDDFLQDREDALTQRRLCVDVLQTA